MSRGTRNPRLLEGVRVVEFGAYLPGPLAGRYLADLGADVTKIEAPGGDPYRTHGAVEGEDGNAYRIVNHGKSVHVLDAKDPQGHAQILAASTGADVFIDGYRPGVCGRLGLGFDDIRRVAPRVVYCSISGFGQDGPRRDHPGHDLTYLALAGVLDRSRSESGEPVRPGIHVSDYLAATYAGLGIAAALAARPRGACYIDLSMTDALVAAQVPQIAESITPAEGSGTSPRNRAYRCSDGRWLAVSAVEPHYWRIVLAVLGMEHLYDEASSRCLDRGRADLEDAVAEAFAASTRATWLGQLEGRVPIAPVGTLDEAMDDAHLTSRHVIGRRPDGGPAVRFPARFLRPQHSDEAERTS